MTPKEIELRLNLLYLQLQVSNLYEKEFKEKLGESGFQNFIDGILDEINYLKKLKNQRQ